MSYDVLQANGRDKDGGQMIKLLENRTCPSGIEEGGLAIVNTRADSSLPRENPGCISLTIQVEATAKSVQTSSSTLSIRSSPLNLFLTSTV